MTATVDAVGAAFEAGLHADADKAPPADIPAPPRKPERDPDAPHGRADDGTPIAPFGIGQNGKPRVKPAGPGRPAEKPRVVASAPAAAGKPGGAAKDYTEDLMGLGTAVWIGASSMRGGKLGPVRLPDTRPYAAVWKQQLPSLATAWNVAAQQDPTVRKYVEQFTGEGSKTWVIGVGIAMVGLVSSCMEMAKAPAEVKAAAAEANDQNMQNYIRAQVAEMGLAA